MITQILLQQTIIMFALMLLGLLLSRRGMITEQGSRDLSNVLLYAVIPCVILRSYMSEFSTEKLRAMGLSALIAVIAFAASIAVAYLTCGTRHRCRLRQCRLYRHSARYRRIRAGSSVLCGLLQHVRKPFAVDLRHRHHFR